VATPAPSMPAIHLRPLGLEGDPLCRGRLRRQMLISPSPPPPPEAILRAICESARLTVCECLQIACLPAAFLMLKNSNFCSGAWLALERAPGTELNFIFLSNTA